jgi:hypothetical protein
MAAVPSEHDLHCPAFSQMLQLHQRALSARQPLWALGELNTDAAGTAMAMEFIALSNHRRVLRAEIARYAELSRVEQIRTLTSATQVLVQEQMLGISPATTRPCASPGPG